MDFSVATVTLRSFSPYSQSKQHDEPTLKGEGKGDYDKRTWKSRRTSPKTAHSASPPRP
ncbi:hypothetical protein A4U53_031095 [Rhizobium ruizarguesonis]|uniref:Uncharacterized protein n=1 Tax=Rhizobium ruizarguesonis TaxID=2081791 RepID=A0ACD5EMP4_9HYPH